MAEADAMAGDRQQGARCKRCFRERDGRADVVTCRSIKLIVHAQEDDAGAGLTRGVEELREIQILSKHHMLMLACPVHEG